MKRSLLITLLAILTTTASPLLAQGEQGARKRRPKSQIKIEMKKFEKAVEATEDFLEKPEGKAPMAELAAAQVSLLKAKEHAPRATSKQPKEKQAEFLKNYKIEVNKAMRGLLDLEDAMLKSDWPAAKKAVEALKKLEKPAHKTFKPRRRRRGSDAGK